MARTIALNESLYEEIQRRAREQEMTPGQLVERILREWIATQSKEYDQYVVRPGDTLARIAARVYGDARLYAALAAFNGIADPTLIHVGQVLQLPPRSVLERETPPKTEEPAPEPELKIEFLPSPHYGERPAGTRIWVIVIHATANSTLTGVIAWFTNPQSFVSAHYVIGKDGRIVQMVREEKRAWHAGRSVWKGIPNVNDYSIGIELVNKNDGLDPYPEEQYHSLVALCKKLVARYNINVQDIVGHRDISLSGKTDPMGLDLERLRQDVISQ